VDSSVFEIFFAVVISGCYNKQIKNEDAANRVKPTSSNYIYGSIESNSGDISVNVDGKYLKKSQVEKEIKEFMDVNKNKIPIGINKTEELLIDKYGQPQSKEALQGIANSYDKIDSWSLPSTKIELRFSYAVGSMGILNIIYSDQILRKEKLDKL